MKTRFLKRLLEEIRDHCRNGIPYDLVFKPTGRLSKEEVRRLEEALKDAFENWRDTWVSPWIDMIEAVALKGSAPSGRKDRKR